LAYSRAIINCFRQCSYYGLTSYCRRYTYENLFVLFPNRSSTRLTTKNFTRENPRSPFPIHTQYAIRFLPSHPPSANCAPGKSSREIRFDGHQNNVSPNDSSSRSRSFVAAAALNVTRSYVVLLYYTRARAHACNTGSDIHP